MKRAGREQIVQSTSWGSAEDLYVLLCKRSFPVGRRFIRTAAAEENEVLVRLKFSLANQSIYQGGKKKERKREREKEE